MLPVSQRGARARDDSVPAGASRYAAAEFDQASSGGGVSPPGSAPPGLTVISSTSEGRAMTTTLTRRALLQTAGGLVAATVASPSRTEASAETASIVIDKLADYMAAAAGGELPADALEHTKHHVLDTFAAMVSGAALPPGRIAHAYARARAGERTATVAASDLLCGPVEAAMVNG